MPDLLPTCFRGRVAGGPPPSTAAGPSLTTSVYETHLGVASLTWSRTVLGLSLRAELRLSDAGEAVDSPTPEEEDHSGEPFRFRVRPWLFWKRRGSKRLRSDGGRHSVVDVAWDLTHARFPPGGGPEPCSGFFLAISVDGEMLLVAGDLAEEAYKRTKAERPKRALGLPVLISRREHVMLAAAGDGGRTYKTRARFGGREREISIEIGEGKERGDAGLRVGVDGRRVLQVRRLLWKFRGSEKVEAEGGARVQVSWDLYNWLFEKPKDEAAPPRPSAAAAGLPELASAAVFVFRFEREEAGEEAGKGVDIRRALVYGGYFGKSRNWSDSSSGGGGSVGGERRGNGRKKSLLKTVSSSSSSSASSASSSSVMEWASPQEAELRSADGFSLLVYAWKS